MKQDLINQIKTEVVRKFKEHEPLDFSSVYDPTSETRFPISDIPGISKTPSRGNY